jgi:hypothetical protein
MRLLLLISVFATLALSAQPSLSRAGLIFSRDRVFIETTVTLPTPPALEKTAAEQASDAQNAVPLQEPVKEKRRYFFDTEIRAEDSLRLEWFLSLDNMPSGRATMIMFDAAEPRTLPPARFFKPIDVLVLGDDGAIIAILPEIILANQTKLISVDLPVKAFMFLRAGEAAQLHIRPKDMVQHALFTLNPTVIQ